MKPAGRRRSRWVDVGRVTSVFLACSATLAAQQPATNPHGKLDESCSTCHSPEAWKPAKVSPAFDHAKKGFVLTGMHQQASCTACHTRLDFHGTAHDCVACHTDAHRGELGTDCARCHTARSFLDRAEMARAHETTRFPLTGAHIATDCESCHPSGPQGRMTFTNRQTDCQDCHLVTYRQTTEPDHTAVGFPTDCEQCHTPVAWAGARFDHARNGFPLTGAHATLACSQCHGSTLTGVLSTACASCHQTDYTATTNPSHVSVQFPTTCSNCHTTTTWSGATFDHNTTGFQLTGAHLTLACSQCHIGTTPGATCVSCHQTDFNSTTDPSHVGAQFPTDCSTCHTTATWSGATFNHDGPYFPIYSGSHAGKWSTCGTCHTNQNDYRVFDCLSCHEHSQTNTDSRHSGISGYSYTSTACYRCHPRGSGG